MKINQAQNILVQQQIKSSSFETLRPATGGQMWNIARSLNFTLIFDLWIFKAIFQQNKNIINECKN